MLIILSSFSSFLRATNDLRESNHTFLSGDCNFFVAARHYAEQFSPCHFTVRSGQSNTIA
jgi:hypothetical protein